MARNNDDLINTQGDAVWSGDGCNLMEKTADNSRLISGWKASRKPGGRGRVGDLRRSLSPGRRTRRNHPSGRVGRWAARPCALRILTSHPDGGEVMDRNIRINSIRGIYAFRSEPMEILQYPPSSFLKTTKKSATHPYGP